MTCGVVCTCVRKHRGCHDCCRSRPPAVDAVDHEGSQGRGPCGLCGCGPLDHEGGVAVGSRWGPGSRGGGTDRGEELRDTHAQVSVHAVGDDLAAIVVQLDVREVVLRAVCARSTPQQPDAQMRAREGTAAAPAPSAGAVAAQWHVLPRAAHGARRSEALVGGGRRRRGTWQQQYATAPRC
jgi:hypothetical protein